MQRKTPTLNKDETFLYQRELKKNEEFNVWFAFPGPESFALSSLGYLWLFKELDQNEDINVERIYSDSITTELMRDKIDLIAFSMSFDMDFIDVFGILKKHNFAYKASERNESDPLIYAGGPVITSNPQPYKDIFDFMVIGDGEGENNIGVNLQIANICKYNKGKTKSEILKLLSEINGIYVPAYYNQKPIEKITKKLPQCIYTPIISENAFFKNTFVLEVERGCANRCAFCLASYMNLPIRFPDYENIIKTIDLGLKYTNKIALLGAQVTAHPRFKDICKYLHNKIQLGEKIEIGVSSLRVDSFTQEIVKILVDGGQKNLTLAIEAGSERLRKVINKNLTNEQIFNAVEVAKSCGLYGLKFYGMLGIPTETIDDIEEIINLTRELKKKYKGFNISYGFSTFVPKANTPFQWFGREDEKTLEKKSKYLQKELHKLGVQVNISSLKWDYYQAVLSRGDEKLTDYLINVYEKGAKLGAFKQCAKELQINTDYYAIENYSYEKKLPWDFINIKPGKEFLIKESKKLLNK